jgi:competence protein ComGC
MNKLREFYEQYKAYIRVDLIFYVFMVSVLVLAVIIISLVRRH